MTYTATGFTKDGQHAFRQWFQMVTHKAISNEQIQVYFDTMNEKADWSIESNVQIEVRGNDTVSGNPEIYVVPIQQVVFEENADA